MVDEIEKATSLNKLSVGQQQAGVQYLAEAEVDFALGRNSIVSALRGVSNKQGTAWLCIIQG
jgi:hypothetical protein